MEHGEHCVEHCGDCLKVEYNEDNQNVYFKLPKHLFYRDKVSFLKGANDFFYTLYEKINKTQIEN